MFADLMDLIAEIPRKLNLFLMKIKIRKIIKNLEALTEKITFLILFLRILHWTKFIYFSQQEISQPTFFHKLTSTVRKSPQI